VIDGRRTLVRAGVIVTLAYLASRVLGLVRNVVFASSFGLSRDLDAYYAAFRIPDAVFQLVAAGALSSALIPVLTGLFARGEDGEAWRVVSNVLKLMLAGLAALCAVMFLLAPWIVPLITPGYAGEKLELTIRMTRIMLLSPMLLALGAVVTSALNARSQFTAAALAPLLYNLAIIAAAVLLVPAFGVDALAIGVVVGSALLLLAQLPAVARAGFRFVAGVELNHPATREVLTLVAPRALGLGATQVTFIVNTAFASTLGDGPVAAYNLAFTVLQVPIGVIGLPLGVVLLPAMSRSLALGEPAAFGAMVTRSTRLLLFVMLFLAVVGAVLGRHVVTLLFDYGRFDDSAVALTAAALTWFLAALPAEAVIVVLARAFYAGHETRTPVLAALVAVAVNVSVSVATVGTLGLRGLALGIAAGAWIEVGLLAIVLARRRSEGMDLSGLARAALVFLAGSLLAGLVAWACVEATGSALGPGHGRFAVLVQAGLATCVAGVVYLAYSLVMHVPELHETLRLVRGATRRGAGS
jgi:putative peptidoglycan lipid II flippase